jgi:hypothetical protein
MEIEAVVRKYGADQYLSGWDREKGMAMVRFTMKGRQIKFVLQMPDKEEFRETGTGRRRQQTAMVERAWEQNCAERWRSLALVIKAKLEAVATGIVSFEEEFLAQIVLPDDTTVAQWMTPQLATVYASGKMPQLMSGK